MRSGAELGVLDRPSTTPVLTLCAPPPPSQEEPEFSPVPQMQEMDGQRFVACAVRVSWAAEARQAALPRALRGRAGRCT